MAAKKTDPKTVAGFFTREEAEWKALTGLWADLPEKDLVRPGACGAWSVKDVMNHIASWMEAARKVIPLRLAGGRPPAGLYTVGNFNPAQYARYRRSSLAASKRRLQRNRKLLLELLRRVPKGELLAFTRRIGSWAKYSTYGHYAEHMRPLAGYRRSLGKDRAKKKALVKQ
jgi:predicted nucleic acid-binding Zn ribbon protein